MRKGHPIQLFIETKDSFELNIKALEELLENEKIKNKPVVVISIAGEMRRGKSFMLNFFLKYLESEDKTNWLYDDNTPLSGFSWKNGKDSDTTGILIWSEPHIMRLNTGEECAVLLMDTQGTFDKKSTMKKNTMVFGFSAMISSMQIFNVNSQLREDSLEFLSVFINYGQLSMEKYENVKPFQHLQFLIRDWNSPYLNPYGMEGGQDYINEFLTFDENDNSQIIGVRRFIKKCFSKIDSCLMPFPGSKVMCSAEFSGKLGNIKKSFVDNLRLYVPKVLSPDYVSPKQINGCNITCQELLEYFKAYFRVFTSNEVIVPQGIFDCTVEAGYMATVKICKRLYSDEMDKICSGGYVKESQLLKEHERVCVDVNEVFIRRKNFGNPEHLTKFQLKLEEDIKELFQSFAERNSMKKKINNEIWSLVIFGMWYVIGTVLQYMVTFVGLDSAASLVGWALFVLLLTAITWGYTYFSGKHSQIMEAIDEIALASMELILKPSYNYIAQKTISSLAKHSLKRIQ